MIFLSGCFFLDFRIRIRLFRFRFRFRFGFGFGFGTKSRISASNEMTLDWNGIASLPGLWIYLGRLSIRGSRCSCDRFGLPVSGVVYSTPLWRGQKFWRGGSFVFLKF